MAEIISKILKVRVAKCQYFYTEQIFQTKFYPRKNAWIAASLVPKRNKFDIKGFLRRTSAENFIIYGWFYDRNSYKFPNFTHTTTSLAKLHVLPHFLPQPSNIFTQIYLPYLWHFATLLKVMGTQITLDLHL